MHGVLQRGWQWYLAPGLVLGGIKLISVLSWFFFSPVAVRLGLAEASPSLPVVLGTFLSGMVGAALAVIAWPFVVYGYVSGKVGLLETLFFPWVQ